VPSRDLPDGYYVKRIYLIICERCNEDITRPLGGDDVTSMDEARREIARHEKEWHPRDGLPVPETAEARS